MMKLQLITFGISPGTINDVRQSLGLEELRVPSFTNKSSHIYDLLGRAYELMMIDSGIYIVNGRKVYLSDL